MIDEAVRDRFRGALLGLAVGDAVGTTVEFKPPGSFEPVSDMVGGGPHRLPAGAWTDDTSMALCLAESLIERGGFDPIDQLERYVRWFREGYLSSIGRCFDIGNATAAALQRFERTGERFPGDDAPTAAGNGALMRLAPVALAYTPDPVQAVERAGESARTTHGDPRSTGACRYFAGLLVGAVLGEPLDTLLEHGVYVPVAGFGDDRPLHPEIHAVASGSFRERQPPEIRGTGFVVEALEAALWALTSTRTFEEGVLAAVNLGDDADTTGAIFGQIGGAVYGAEAIPARWREKVFMSEEIVGMADALYDLAWGTGPARATGRQEQPQQQTLRPGPAEEKILPGDSYWVDEGRLLAGPYPGAVSKAEAQAKLDAFLDVGVTCFIDLTEEGEGPPLKPYSSLLRGRAAKRGVGVTHLRLPIRDVDIAHPWQMRAILQTIDLALDEGETVYVHCWGGVGRTGSVVGCLLVARGCPATEVLGRIAEMRAETQRAHRASPETPAQCDFVTSWQPSPATIVLDQDDIDRLRPEPLPEQPAPIPTLGQIVLELGRGDPVVIEGPGPGWCVQAVAHDDWVRVEVLDPEHWDSGPPLPSAQREIFALLGLEREEGAWTQKVAGDDAAGGAARLMHDVVSQAWGLQSGDVSGQGEVSTSDSRGADYGS